MKRPKPAVGNAAPGAAHAGPPPGCGHMHSVLPLFNDIQTLATISIAIEILFVVLAIFAYFLNKGNLAEKNN